MGIMKVGGARIGARFEMAAAAVYVYLVLSRGGPARHIHGAYAVANLLHGLLPHRRMCITYTNTSGRDRVREG